MWFNTKPYLSCHIYLLNLRELYITGYNRLIVHALIAVRKIQLSLVPARFVMKGFHCKFLHDTSHVAVRQRIPKLILHTMLNVYPPINLWIKWYQFFRYLLCDADNNKSFGLVFTDVNKVLNCTAYILDDILVFLSGLLYDILCQMLSFWFLTSFWLKDFFGFLPDSFHVGVR